MDNGCVISLGKTGVEKHLMTHEGWRGAV